MVQCLLSRYFAAPRQASLQAVLQSREVPLDIPSPPDNSCAATPTQDSVPAQGTGFHLSRSFLPAQAEELAHDQVQLSIHPGRRVSRPQPLCIVHPCWSGTQARVTALGRSAWQQRYQHARRQYWHAGGSSPGVGLGGGCAEAACLLLGSFTGVHSFAVQFGSQPSSSKPSMDGAPAHAACSRNGWYNSHPSPQAPLPAALWLF